MRVFWYKMRIEIFFLFSAGAPTWTPLGEVCQYDAIRRSTIPASQLKSVTAYTLSSFPFAFGVSVCGSVFKNDHLATLEVDKFSEKLRIFGDRFVMPKSVTVVGYKRRLIALILASLLVLIGIHRTAKLTESDVARAPTWQQNGTDEMTTQRRPTVSRSSLLDVVLPGSFDTRNETFNCITARLTSQLSIPVCLYAASMDVYISGVMARGGYFEADEVSRFMRLLQLDRRLQFVDIGAMQHQCDVSLGPTSLQSMQLLLSLTSTRKCATSRDVN